MDNIGERANAVSNIIIYNYGNRAQYYLKIFSPYILKFGNILYVSLINWKGLYVLDFWFIIIKILNVLCCGGHDRNMLFSFTLYSVVSGSVDAKTKCIISNDKLYSFRNAWFYWDIKKFDLFTLLNI